MEKSQESMELKHDRSDIVGGIRVLRKKLRGLEVVSNA